MNQSQDYAFATTELDKALTRAHEYTRNKNHDSAIIYLDRALESLLAWKVWLLTERKRNET